MVRVLHIVNRWRQGGVERFVEGLVDGCRKGDVEQSILSICTGVPSAVDCPKYGPMHAGDSMVSMLQGARALDAFLAAHRFDVAHIHTQNSSGFLYASIAKRHGVPCRIIHSHNTSLGYGAGAVKRAAQGLFRTVYGGAETVRLACSTEAGNHLFPDGGFMVVPNGIDTERFRFDAAAREEIRGRVGVGDDEMLVACVGSMVATKNHIRALSIFAEFHNRNPRSRLLILGDGELRQDLETRACSLGIADAVSMPGFVERADRWYSAMDAVLFPSLYEGLPVSLVEAQCNGLPVVCSDTITREVGLLDTCTFISLEKPNSVWVIALEKSQRDITGVSVETICNKGFDRSSTIKLMIDIYKCSDGK